MKKFFTIVALACALCPFASAASEEVTFTTTTLGDADEYHGDMGMLQWKAQLSFEFTLDEALFSENSFAVTEASNGANSYHGLTSVTLESIVFNKIWIGGSDNFGSVLNLVGLPSAAEAWFPARSIE